MFEDNQTFEQFLDDYYMVGPGRYLRYVGRIPDSDLKKILTHDKSNWYEYAYMKEVQAMLSVYSEIYKLLDKKPGNIVGESFKYTTDFGLLQTAIGPGGATTIFGTPTEPTISTIQGIEGGIENVPLSRDLHSMLKEKRPESHPGQPDWDFLTKDWAPKAFWHKIDKWLGGYETAAGVHGVDTPALKNIECIDRMITNQTESGATNHVDTATDGDIIWDGVGTGTRKIRREAGDGDTWANAQVKLPAAAGTADAYNIMDELDDLMAAAKPYSKNKRYIGLTTGKTMNKIEAELGAKQRFLEKTVKVQPTIGGVETRSGVEGGFDVGALVLCGVTVPMFTSEALPTKNSVYTAATSGHVYLIDLDGMFIRVDLPVTYLESGFGAEMLSINYFQSRALLFTVAQLVCTNFQSQAALKWIKA